MVNAGHGLFSKIRTDLRVGGIPQYYLSVDPRPLMRVPDVIKKCVVFLAYDNPDGKEILAGTGFFLGVKDSQFTFGYLVTAAHIVEGAKWKNRKLFVKVNKKEGCSQRIEIDDENLWQFHPTDQTADLAVLSWPFQFEHDFLIFPSEASATPDKLDRDGMGVGDEVFLVGLYRKHSGIERNMPIIRIGNLAAIPDEPVVSSRGPMDGYLVEIRSIYGISGSPAFIRSCVIDEDERGQLVPMANTFYFLGLMHGRWDVKLHNAPEMIEIDDPENLGQPLNTGIAVIVPAHKVIETLHHPIFVERRKATLVRMRDEEATSID